LSLFLLTFLILYGGMHFYLYRKLSKAFALPLPVTLCISLLMAGMIGAPILVRLTERAGYEQVAVVLAYTGYLWMGFLFLFFITSLVFDCGSLIVRHWASLAGGDISCFQPTARHAFLVAIFVSSGITTYGFIEALAIRTEKVTIKTDKLPLNTDRLRIVQISDVHLGLIVNKGRLQRIVSKIREARPDILVSTGDLVDGQMDSMAEMASQLHELVPRYGKFAVTGNHEYYAGIDQALDFTRKAGFKVLRGALEDTVEGLTIAGVDDPAGRSFGIGTHSEGELLEKLPLKNFILLLKHRPTVEKNSTGLFDLQLSGHIHKGQIFPFGAVTRLFYPVRTGFSALDRNSGLYVSRGTGTWGPPIRFLAPPEITVIDLVRAGSGS
jgi:uncharacterized protein